MAACLIGAPGSGSLVVCACRSCPFHSTMDKVHKLSRSDDGIGKISLLILGAFVKNSRECTAEAEAGHHAKLDAFQTEMNDVFHAALKERR